MTHFLISAEKPDGYRLEDILVMIRKDIILRATKIVDDERPEARKVLDNSVRILQLLGDSIALAEDSTQILNKNFGPGKTGQPRIGVR